MSFDHYIQSGGKRLRCGYTTGTCAALAAQGAARLLLTGQVPERVSLRTPKGWVVEVPVENPRLEDGMANAVRPCGVPQRLLVPFPRGKGTRPALRPQARFGAQPPAGRLLARRWRNPTKQGGGGEPPPYGVLLMMSVP